MADVRCPMCGKLNPGDRDTCQYCDARLKPLFIKQPQDIERSPEPEVPDWLSSLQTDQDSDVEAGSIEENSGDWLSDIRSELGEDSQSIETDQASETDESDWLNRLDESTQETEKPDDYSLPDWREDSQAEATKPATNTISDEQQDYSPDAQEPTGKVEPDWLSEAMIRAAEPEGNELPVWIKDLSTEARKPAGEDSLDWLSELSVLEPDSEQAQSMPWISEHADSISPLGDEPQSEPSNETQPDWLNELKTSITVPTDAQVPVEASPLLDGEIIGSLPGVESELGVELDSGLPDWLFDALPEASQSKVVEPKEEVPGILPADLPPWLEQFRPVEIAGVPTRAGESGNLLVEGAGPLAGLRGVLPAEPDIAHIRKPPVYSVKLEVSDIQQAQADLLKQIIKNEAEAQAISGSPIITPQHLLRILIGLLLILSILAPIALQIPEIEPPSILSGFTGEMQTRQLIEIIMPGQPVIVAVDYEPGFSGEMEAALGAVLGHLIARQAYLTLVSSTPTGPIQGERLIRMVNQNYASPEQYINLGFVSGGTSGLLSFIESPRSTLPRTWTGGVAWEGTALQNIVSLDNFALIVVATESAEAARAWIEQAYPRLNGKPLVMIVSAQIDPIVRPYFEAYPRQIQGLVSGLAGGAVYEGSFGKKGNANAYWASFSVGLLMACVLIILGIVLTLISSLLSHGKETIGKEG